MVVLADDASHLCRRAAWSNLQQRGKDPRGYTTVRTHLKAGSTLVGIIAVDGGIKMSPAPGWPSIWVSGITQLRKQRKAYLTKTVERGQIPLHVH